jgi:probable phosphoglycerate mutase
LLSGSPTTLEDRLIEMDWGDWEGRTLADLRAELGEALQINEDNGLDFRPDGGESPRGVQDRLRPWLVEIAGEGRDVAAVTHKGVIRALMAEAYGWEMMGTPPVKLDWTRLHLFHIDAEGRPEPVEMNIPLGLGGQEP